MGARSRRCGPEGRGRGDHHADCGRSQCIVPCRSPAGRHRRAQHAAREGDQCRLHQLCRGGVAATQHLLSLGHRRIAYVGGPASAACNQARMHGFRGTMHTAGIPVTEGYVSSEQQTYGDGVARGTELLDLSDPPTAVLAFSDELALGVVEAARVRGFRIPADLSVVGFDDTQMARLSSPPLTTVRQRLREMGALALRTAVRLAAGARVDFRHVELATELVVRGSTAPIDVGCEDGFEGACNAGLAPLRTV